MTTTFQNSGLHSKIVRTGGVTYYRQTADLLRKYIHQQNLKPGDKLPSVRKILSHLQISQSTLDKALLHLDQEGFIERHRGRGIFVSDRLSVGEIAVVLKSPLIQSDSSPWYRMAFSGLANAIHKQGSGNWQVKMHSGVGSLTDMGEDFAKSLDLLEPDVLRRLRGVFTFHPLHHLHSELEKASVPVVKMGSGDGPYMVGFDGDDGIISQAVEHLHSTGCRSVGMLWCKPLHSQAKESDVVIAQHASAHGLICRQEWILSPRAIATEQLGYELFMQLWHQPVRPEGLVMLDDVMCRGVLRAVLQLGLKLPEDLQLVTRVNKNADLPYHKPVTSIEFDVEKQVQLAAEMMVNLISGNAPSEGRIFLPGKLVIGSTTKTIKS